MEDWRRPSRSVIAVELPDPDNADHLAQELSTRFPAAVTKQEGSWDVAVYCADGDSRFIVDALDAVEVWLHRCGPAAVRVRVGERTYLLEAAGQSFIGD